MLQLQHRSGGHKPPPQRKLPCQPCRVLQRPGGLSRLAKAENTGRCIGKTEAGLVEYIERIDSEAQSNGFCNRD